MIPAAISACFAGSSWQVGRILGINQLQANTAAVVEAARESSATEPRDAAGAAWDGSVLSCPSNEGPASVIWPDCRISETPFVEIAR